MSNFNITSGPIPSLEIEITPSHTIMTGSGAWLGGSPYLQQTTTFYKPENRNRLISMLVSGEGATINYITNHGTKPSKVIISDGVIGKVVPISNELTNGILCLRGAFIAATNKIDIDFKQVRSFSLSQVTHQSMWMQYCKQQKEEAKTTLFLMCPTEPIEISLDEDEPYLLDNNALFAMTPSVKLRPYEVSGLKNRHAGGEGRFMTVATGKGKIWLAPPAHNNKNSSSRNLLKLIPGL